MFFVFWELCARSFAFWCSFVELCPTHHARPRASLRLTCCECLAAPPTPWLHCVVPCTPQACCMVLCFVGRVTGWQRDAPCAAGADAQGARVRLPCCRAALALTMCHDWGACCGQQAGVHAPALCMPFEQHDCFAPYDKNPFIACKCTACLPAFFIGGAARPVCVRALEPKRRVAYTTAQHESLSERKSWFNESLSPTQLKGTLDHSSLNTNCGASCFAPTPASPPAPLVPPSKSTRHARSRLLCPAAALPVRACRRCRRRNSRPHTLAPCCCWCGATLRPTLRLMLSSSPAATGAHHVCQSVHCITTQHPDNACVHSHLLP